MAPTSLSRRFFNLLSGASSLAPPYTEQRHNPSDTGSHGQSHVAEQYRASQAADPPFVMFLVAFEGNIFWCRFPHVIIQGLF